MPLSMAIAVAVEISGQELRVSILELESVKTVAEAGTTKNITMKKWSFMIDHITTARKAILDDLKARAMEGDVSVKATPKEDLGRWHMPQENYYVGCGKMKCPVCNEGELRYSRASYNGHVHAKCSTQGCVAWME